MKQIPEVLDSIVLDAKARANINYVKARCAIEAAFPNRTERRAAKMAVVEALGGQVIHPEQHIANKAIHAPNYVLFGDKSQARF